MILPGSTAAREAGEEGLYVIQATPVHHPPPLTHPAISNHPSPSRQEVNPAIITTANPRCPSPSSSPPSFPRVSAIPTTARYQPFKTAPSPPLTPRAGSLLSSQLHDQALPRHSPPTSPPQLYRHHPPQLPPPHTHLTIHNTQRHPTPTQRHSYRTNTSTSEKSRRLSNRNNTIPKPAHTPLSPALLPNKGAKQTTTTQSPPPRHNTLRIEKLTLGWTDT